MNDSCDRPGPRRTVLEMQPEPNPGNRRGGRTNKKKHNVVSYESVNVNIDVKNRPIELTPVIDAVQEYGRRTHSLGALEGANAITALLNKIKSIEPTNSELKQVIVEGEKSVDHLKSYLHKVYVMLLRYT